MISQLLPEAEPCPADSGKNRRLLIVEDDPTQREALTLQLKGQGFEIVAAATGSAALALAAEQAPALVVVDVGLPDMSGWEVSRQLVDEPATADVPVIALSGIDHCGALRHSRASGCRYFVRKPYDPNALLVLIESALRDEQAW